LNLNLKKDYFRILNFFENFRNFEIFNSLQETIARQTIELTFEPCFHWTTNFKTSKISKIGIQSKKS
jgi:hypothetical protein